MIFIANAFVTEGLTRPVSGRKLQQISIDTLLDCVILVSVQEMPR